MQMQIVLRRAAAALLVAWAAPLAAQAPAASPDSLLAAEGIDAAPPPGFPAFERVRDDRDAERTRLYHSRSGTRIILVMVYDPLFSWGEGAEDVAGRHEILRIMAGDRRATAGTDVVMREDATHVIAERHRENEDGRRSVARWYIPRTGAPRIGMISVVDTATAPDPAADPEIAAFLDAARLRADGGPPVRLTFRQAGVEMRLPAGVMQPSAPADGRAETVSGGSSARGFRSRSGKRHVMVMVIDEAGGERWPAERRIRHMQGWMRDILHRYAAQSGEARTEGELGVSDLRFSRVAGEPATGRGRFYTALSGPRRLVMVLYWEPGTAPLANEAEIVEMLDSLRLAEPARR